MNDTTFDLDEIRTQQKVLRQHGRLQWIHWLILALSVVITFVAWNFSNKMLQSRAQSRFDREAAYVVDQVRDRLIHYEDALRSGAATMLAYNGNISREKWKAYAAALDLTTRYPGVNGIGVIRELDPQGQDAFEANQQLFWPDFKVHPTHDYPIKLPIVYIEPAELNVQAIGLDVAFEENRRTAALLARDSGEPQISGPITLVQDEGQTPGFLFYMPFFLENIGFDGFVYAPLVVKKLVGGVLGNQERHVFFSITDNESVLYDEISGNDQLNKDSYLSTRLEDSFYGRDWEFTIASSDAFFADSDALQPLVVLISGLVIDAMLFMLFFIMARSNRNTLLLADVLISKLGEQTLSLSQKNTDLESFAHVVSHDLKTPIRAIHSLSEFIEEDVDELVSSESTKEVLKEHTRRIHEQVVRSDALIKGILNFSIVGKVSETPASVDVSELVRSIRESLSIPPHQVRLLSPMPRFETYPTLLSQVFENLIANAYKYHPNQSEVQIDISVEDNGQFHRFYVADNGDGIAPEYRDRIFSPFVTLQAEPTASSSGIGLSIVKKSVEVLGGQIGIVDEDGCDGVKFYFDWPKITLTHNMSTDDAA